MEILLYDGEQESATDDGVEKKERIVKPDIIIQVCDKMRVTLMSDRKNLKVQVKSGKQENNVEDEDAGWSFRGYYGTANWKGVIERLCALSIEEKLEKNQRTVAESLNTAICSNTEEIKDWAHRITETLITNKINL
jgi:hypothetical protein